MTPSSKSCDDPGFGTQRTFRLPVIPQEKGTRRETREGNQQREAAGRQVNILSQASRAAFLSSRPEYPSSAAAVAQYALGGQRVYGNAFTRRTLQRLQEPLAKGVGSDVGSSWEHLDERTGVTMGALLGQDFRPVRIRFDKSANELGALAYTCGADITVAPDVSLETPEGQGLLAHELVHVSQQAQGRASALEGVGGDWASRQALEQEAEAVQDKVERGVRAAMRDGSTAELAVQRFASSSRGAASDALQLQARGDSDEALKRTAPRFELIEVSVPAPAESAEPEEVAMATQSLQMRPVQADGEGGGGPSLGDVVNVAKTAWEIMKDGRPVVNATTDYANAVPSGVPWSALTGWALEPMALRWRYHTENALGFNDTDIYFKLKWDYNGRHRGHGRFINRATCIIESHDQAWGNTFESNASIKGVENRGTPANPLADLAVDIGWREHNILQNFGGTWEFRVRGDGSWSQG